MDVIILAYIQIGRKIYLKKMFKNKQGNNLSNIHSVNQEIKQYFNLPDLGLSSALGLLTPNVGNTEDKQIPMKKKRKKRPKQGFRR